MMNLISCGNRTHYLFCCLWICSAALLHAQTSPEPEKVAPPSPPFVATPPPGSQWSVEIKHLDSHATKNGDEARREALPKKLEMLIGENKIQQGTIEYDNGQKLLFYVAGKNVFQKVGDAVIMMTASDDDPENVEGLRVRVFPCISWLSTCNYAGTESGCYKFKKEHEQSMTLWVRISDRSPVRAQIGKTVYTFTAITSYPQNVNLPPAYAAKVEQIQAQNQALENLRALN